MGKYSAEVKYSTSADYTFGSNVKQVPFAKSGDVPFAWQSQPIGTSERLYVESLPSPPVQAMSMNAMPPFQPATPPGTGTLFGSQGILPGSANSLVGARSMVIPFGGEIVEEFVAEKEYKKAPLIADNGPWIPLGHEGDPSVRVDPHWREGEWWLAAPVDFKGLDALPDDRKAFALQKLEDIVWNMDQQGVLPSMPPPNHVQDGPECFIA